MRRISIAIALVFSTVSLFSVSSAQQTSNANPSQAEPQRSPAPPPGPVIGGDGTTNYIPIWAAPSYLLSSVIYQASGGKVGIGTTTPSAKLDVSGAVNAMTYNLVGFPVISAYPDYLNLFVGIGAGASGGGSGGNTFVGNGAGQEMLIGQGNTYVGYDAGRNATESNFNSYFGWAAGLSSTGGENAFFGYDAGSGNTTGTSNAFFGADSGVQNATGDSNSFFGANTGFENTQGSSDTFLGYLAGENNTIGSGNTFIGTSAGYRNATGSNNIYINNTGPIINESGVIRIGTPGNGFGDQTATYIAGIYGSNSSSGIPVYINANGQLGTQPSSLRFKEQVRDMGDSTSALMKLRPVTFLYKPEYDKGPRTLQYGLIAEEVAKVYPELVAYDNDGQPYSVRYQYLSTMLLNEVQKQYRLAEAEAKVIETQEQKINDLEQRLSRLEALVGTQIDSAQAVPERHTSSGGPQ